VMHLIDLSTVLRQTVACDLYSNLVTRPTGAAVRLVIERMLEDSSELEERSLTVIDLTHVSMLDFSCADEVIAKLVLRYCEAKAPRDAYFLFRGVTEDHWAAIESVLERHGLALVVEREGEVHLVGVVEDGERRLWETIRRLGPVDATDIVIALGGEQDEVERQLDALWRRRLVMKLDRSYVAVGQPRG
jgi:hypothetical protein